MKTRSSLARYGGNPPTALNAYRRTTMLGTNNPAHSLWGASWHIREGGTSAEEGVADKLMGTEDDLGSLGGPAHQVLEPGMWGVGSAA